MTTLIIARHGNTFGAGDTPTRVGRHTDLPLVEKGHAQGRAIGAYLKENGLIPDMVYASTLQRTQQTAKAAIKETGVGNPVYTLDIFDEIDYGPDENKVEADVIERIGADAITAWDAEGTVPDGWAVDPAQIIQNWIGFGAQITAHEGDDIVLVVTSNGIARFAPHLTGDFDGFATDHDIKLSTGSLGILKYDGSGWTAAGWNIKP